MFDREYQYYAFISYSWKDKRWGKWLQRKLESYRLPAAVRKRNPDYPKRLKVFRDKTDIRIGSSLHEILRDELAASKYLIVICSPYSARSEWVSREIEEFIAMGRKERILLFIVDGVPYSGEAETECYPDVIKRHFPEYLGADVNEQGSEFRRTKREKAFVRIVAQMFGLNFDVLWNRHRRYLIRQLTLSVLLSVGFLTVVGWTWHVGRPFDAEVRLREATVVNPHLPPLSDAVMTLSLDNETKRDTLRAFADAARWTNIPSKYKSRPVRLCVSASGFCPVDTVVTLEKNVVLPVRRNAEMYGEIIACLYDIERERPVTDVPVEVAGRTVRTDGNGYLRLSVPLAEQRPSYPLRSSVYLLDSCIYMPCDSNAVIRCLTVKSR